MRKSDKLKNFKKVNLIAEQRYLVSKGIANNEIVFSAVNFNKDFGVNYTRHELGGPGGGTVAPYGVADLSGGALQRFPFRQTNDNIYGVAIGDILDYSNSNKFKTLKNIGGFDKNSASGVVGDVYMNSFLWRSTEPISTISLTTGAWNWKQHTRISLYGIKG